MQMFIIMLIYVHFTVFQVTDTNLMIEIFINTTKNLHPLTSISMNIDITHKNSKFFLTVVSKI